MALDYSLFIGGIMNKKDADPITAGDLKNVLGCVAYILANAGTGSTSLSADIVNALNVAASPSSANPIATIADLAIPILSSGTFVTTVTNRALLITADDGNSYYAQLVTAS